MTDEKFIENRRKHNEKVKILRRGLLQSVNDSRKCSNKDEKRLLDLISYGYWKALNSLSPEAWILNYEATRRQVQGSILK